jgi:hypothetical protein
LTLLFIAYSLYQQTNKEPMTPEKELTALVNLCLPNGRLVGFNLGDQWTDGLGQYLIIGG